PALQGERMARDPGLRHGASERAPRGRLRSRARTWLCLRRRHRPADGAALRPGRSAAPLRRRPALPRAVLPTRALVVRVPRRWLAEGGPWDGLSAGLAERMRMAGVKVGAVEEVGDLDARIRVARLEDVRPHPQTSRLTICRLDLGGESRKIVSPAPGLAAEQRLAVALAGAVLPNGRSVGSAELGGGGTPRGLRT